MAFAETLRQFSKQAVAKADPGMTEQTTKTALIYPFLEQVLGYPSSDPSIVFSEYTADLGKGKSEKVDIALLFHGDPKIVVECKPVKAKLDGYQGQLFKYFVAARARFGILTNGVEYRFYTDLDNANLMDAAPFLVVDLLDIKESQVPELKKFRREGFSVMAIMASAEKLKYTRSFQKTFSKELEKPSDDLVRLFLKPCHHGTKTQQLVEKYRPVLKRVMANRINEILETKMKLVIHPDQAISPGLSSPVPSPAVAVRTSTTSEEIEAYCLVKHVLSDLTDTRSVSFKDTGSYFGVLYAGNTWKWICRFRFTSTSKTLILPDTNKNEIKIDLRDVYEIPRYADKLREVLRRYLNGSHV